MSKNKTRFYIVLAILFAVLTVIAFALPFEKSRTFWISYAFAVIAIAVQIYAYPKAFEGSSVRSKFYGFPIARVTTVYLILQIVLSLVFMVAGKWIPSWLSLVLFVLLLGATAIGFISADAMRDEVERQDTFHKANTTTMRDLQSKVIMLSSQCDDTSIKPRLEHLAELFRFSDPVSSEAIIEVEKNLSATVDDLQSAVLDHDNESSIKLCSKVEAELSERNRLCKLNK